MRITTRRRLGLIIPRGLAMVLLLTTSLLGATPTNAEPRTPRLAASYQCLGDRSGDPSGGLYPEPRVFLESHGWWIADDGTIAGRNQTGTNYGHLHLGTCFPLNQHVSGTLGFDIRLVLMDNPGQLFHIHPFICLDVTNVTCPLSQFPDMIFNPAYTLSDARCSATSMETDCWVHMNIDTTKYANDGWASIRFRAEVKEPPDATSASGDVLRASNDWLVYVDNPGKPIENFAGAPNWLEGKGWYTISLYANAKLLSPYPIPASGPYTMKFACGGTTTVDDCMVTIDPDWHMTPIDNGTVLYRDTTLSQIKGARTMTFDLSKLGLSPGTHYLVIRNLGVVSTVAGSSTKSGQIWIPITVNP